MPEIKCLVLISKRLHAHVGIGKHTKCQKDNHHRVPQDTSNSNDGEQVVLSFLISDNLLAGFLMGS